jgi:hypothetical protein
LRPWRHLNGDRRASSLDDYRLTEVALRSAVASD